MFAPSSRIVLLIYCYVGTWWFQNVRAANCYWNSPLCDLLGQGGVFTDTGWLLDVLVMNPGIV